MIAAETWLSAQDALDHGLVDEILGQEGQTAMSPGALVNAFGLPDIDALRAAYDRANPQQPQQTAEPDWRMAARLAVEQNRF